MTKAELLERTKKFALNIIWLVNSIPKNSINSVLCSQLLRSGTSVAANYRAAVRAKSRADFIYKIKLIEEEADESCFWHELMRDCGLTYPVQLTSLLKEADELTAIFTQIGKTTKAAYPANRKSKIPNQ
jgi:four helix bundle protein